LTTPRLISEPQAPAAQIPVLIRPCDARKQQPAGTNIPAVGLGDLGDQWNKWAIYRWFMDDLPWFTYMGVSENSVPLNPMVNDHYPY
jgi:hypothetical protein